MTDVTEFDASKDQKVGTEPVEQITEASGSVDKLFIDEFDPVYLAKSKLLSDALQEIGMGRYQWRLFVIAGFGWMADNV